MRTALLLSTLAALTSLSAHSADWLYLTVPGDTLSGIGQTYLRNPKDWPKVQSANGVPIPKHLPSNSRLKIPVELLKMTPAPVKVIALQGNVRFKSGDGGYQPLTSGALLNGGETVLTGLGSSVSYLFADNTRLTQQASSKLSFGRLASFGKTGMVSNEVSLDSGRLEASAAKQLAPAGGFKVHTPVAVAGLRGTGFRLNLAEDGKTLRNEVTEGAVAVSAQGEEVRVEAGFGTYAELGKPPVAAVSLLPKPDLAELSAKITRLPVSFAWPGYPAARTWRVQVSSDANFLTLMQDDIVDRPAVQMSDAMPDGDYFLRIRAIDALGLEGFDAQHAFNLSARPLPPMPQKPALGELLSRHEVELAWLAAEGANGYLLQLAPTPEFTQGLIERQPGNREYSSETLPAGEWHWRIASIDQHGQARAFSPHRAFRVLPPPAVPVLPAEMEHISTTSPEANLHWHAVADALAYRVQISPSPDFSRTIVDQKITDVRFSTRLPEAGNWHWRIASLGLEDVTQGYSKTGIWQYRPLPAAPSAPQVRFDGVVLHAAWTGNAAAYRLEFSRNEGFSDLAGSHVVSGQEARIAQPPAGKYWLRVISLNADKQESAPSTATPFEIQSGFKPWWLLPLLMFAP